MAKLKKINKINNIGSFTCHDWGKVISSHKTDPNGNPLTDLLDSDFKKFNLVFGHNGAGKSTLTRILRRASGENLILEKNWDNETGSQDFQIELDDGSLVNFDGSNLDNAALQDKVVFFDNDFIEDYVQSSDKRETSHDKKTGQLFLYLGDFYRYEKEAKKFRCT